MRLIHLCFVLTVLLAVPVLAAADDFSWTPTNPTSDQSIEFTATLSNFCVSSFTWYDETDGTVVIGQGEKIIKKLPAGKIGRAHV